MSEAAARAAVSTAAATCCAVAVTAGTKSASAASTWASARTTGRTLRIGRRGRRPEHVDRVGHARLRRKQLAQARDRLLPEVGQYEPCRVASVGGRGSPSPPAFVRTATRRPGGSGWVESRVATSISSSSEPARMTPAWWKSASTAASEPASAAVCELAARWPVAVVPLLSARIGFRRATRRASRPNRRGLPNDSTYRSTTSVSSSSSHHSSRSFDDTSALLPIDTKAESPRPRDSVASRRARPRAPDCDEKPMLPLGARRAGESGVEPRASDRDAETVRADEPGAVGTNEREQPILSFDPLAPELGEACGDHDERPHAARAAHPRRRLCTCAAGTEITARSTCSPISPIER